MREFDPFQIHRPINDLDLILNHCNKSGNVVDFVGITNRSSQMTLYMYQLMWTSRGHDMRKKLIGLTVHLKEKYNAEI